LKQKCRSAHSAVLGAGQARSDIFPTLAHGLSAVRILSPKASAKGSGDEIGTVVEKERMMLDPKAAALNDGLR